MTLSKFKDNLKEQSVPKEYHKLACIAYGVSKVSDHPIEKVADFTKVPADVRVKISEAMEI